MRKTYVSLLALILFLSACQRPKPELMVNWIELEDKLVAAGEAVLRDASRKYATESFYGLVIETPQNWGFELHLNTEAGLADGIANFRRDSVGYENKTDSEIAAILGRWYFQSWKFRYLSMSLDPVLIELNDANHDLLEEARDQGNGDDVEDKLRSAYCVQRIEYFAAVRWPRYRRRSVFLRKRPTRMDSICSQKKKYNEPNEAT